MRYKSKPVEIDAILFDGFNKVEVMEWAVSLFKPGDLAGSVIFTDENECKIATLEGIMTARPNTWIIKGLKGELYPCVDEVFKQKYEEV